ncbi:MAG: Gldg family protein [Chloroflexota bacterium]
MKPEWRRFAPLGLYLALLAVLVSAGLYIVLREWGLPLQISLGLIVVGLALFAFLDPDRVRMAFTGRQARYGSNALVLTVAFVGILVLINYFVYQNSKRWDLTEDKQYTLTQETLDTLKSLPEPVQAVAFFTSSYNPDQAKSLLEQYKYNADGKFDYEFVDPNDNPVAAEEAKISRDGTIVLKMGGNQEPVTMASEQELTGAIVRLMSPEKRHVYFLTGHGEYSPTDTGDRAYAQVKRALESKNYSVDLLSLLATNQVPEDAKVVVIAGPRKPLAATEVELLKQYVDNGGTLVVMEEPVVVTDYNGADDPLSDYLGEVWGIKLADDMVMDATSQQPYAPYAAQYGSHAITQKMQRITSVFPTVRSVTVTEAPSGVSAVQLVLTAPQSWAETNIEGLLANPPQVAYDDGQDQMGPISLAAAAEDFNTKGRVVVFGDADFVIDANYAAYGNSDLFINSVDWAAGQEQLISLTAKQNTQRFLAPPQRTAMNLIMLATVIILPGLSLLAGIVVWIIRRRRG